MYTLYIYIYIIGVNLVPGSTLVKLYIALIDSLVETLILDPPNVIKFALEFL